MIKSERLGQLNERYREQFKGKEIVLGDGNPDAKLLLVGEAPGKEEVKLQKPFVGAAGKNLSAFLEVLGLARESIYITNAIKFRLSKVNDDTGRISNRPASAGEIEESRPFLMEEIEIVQPDYIITLGNVPLKAVVGESAQPIGSVHGELNRVSISGKEYALYPLYHPASLIYNRSLKEVYDRDVENLKQILDDAHTGNI